MNSTSIRKDKSSISKKEEGNFPNAFLCNSHCKYNQYQLCLTGLLFHYTEISFPTSQNSLPFLNSSPFQMPIETRGRKRTQDPDGTPAPLTPAEEDFLSTFYFSQYEPLSAPPAPPAAGFRVRKVLRARYLSTHFWASLKRVPRPAATPADVVYVDPAHLHSLEQGLLERDPSRHRTYKELAYEVLSAAETPMSVPEIIAAAKAAGLLRTAGMPPEQALRVEIRKGLQRHGAMFPFAKLGHCVYLRHREAEVLSNLLITPRYRALGMCLWEGRYKHVPAEREHRFLRYGASTIGGGAGLGVFVRGDVSIPRGTILCEYAGVVAHLAEKRSDPNAPTAENALHAYSVHAGGGTPDEKVIHGKDRDGFVQCFAALINDAGPANANSAYVELDQAPGRVFVITQRRLLPGEEVFILYGATYWDIAAYPTQRAYPDLRDWARLTEHCPAAHPPGEIVVERCLFCGKEGVPLRILPLHATYECVDVADVGERRVASESDVESLPRNMFTAESGEKGGRWQRGSLATALVDWDDPLTYGFTHVDIAGEIERRKGKSAECESQNVGENSEENVESEKADESEKSVAVETVHVENRKTVENFAEKKDVFADECVEKSRAQPVTARKEAAVFSEIAESKSSSEKESEASVKADVAPAEEGPQPEGAEKQPLTGLWANLVKTVGLGVLREKCATLGLYPS